VGGKFVEIAAREGYAHRGLSRSEVDYTDGSALKALIRESKPEFIVNAAGYTGKPNVDACERDKTNCLDGNAVLPGMLADICREMEVPWGHVSSGCIFSGRKRDGSPFDETDTPNFSFRQNHCSFYSGTKALGEETIGYGQSEDGHSWVPTREESGYLWRLRIPFNHEASPRNFLTKLTHYERLLDAENSISHLDEFVKACLRCWDKGIPYGIYNVTNPGSITTREVVELIRQSPPGKKLEAGGKEFRFFEDEAEFMRLAAKTPRSNCVLSSDKLARAGIELTPVREAIQNSLEQWTESN